MMYSNCLIEAIKAKLRHPKSIRILYLPKEWNRGNLHFYWVKDDTIHHYEATSENAGFLFNGKFKKQNLETFEAFLLRSLAISKPKLDKSLVAKKLHFKSVEQPGMLNWVTYCPELDMFDLPKKTRICKLLMVKSNNSEIKIVKISDFKKENYKWVQWKYLSPYCQEYRLFNTKQV